MGIFGNAFTGWHLIAVLAIVLLLFGAPKLPALARSIGQSMKIFKQEIKTDKADTDTREPEALRAEAPPVAAVEPAPKAADAPPSTPKQ
ncbi:twin-arginine translocase TatA/TatE family subunit [Naasia sp. SYSU D00948]|uniref:twin-arginine translocase TatA/TatE family subunit n=1 Tax=Naasia sp. SYSU D00948 TaxID=2817379 RepID=UPI001B30A0B3|nr:twin-arginine translocase TatA/TatE family subunit [Naasia sp. SYSU D00948]